MAALENWSCEKSAISDVRRVAIVRLETRRWGMVAFDPKENMADSSISVREFGFVGC